MFWARAFAGERTYSNGVHGNYNFYRDTALSLATRRSRALGDPLCGYPVRCCRYLKTPSMNRSKPFRSYPTGSMSLPAKMSHLTGLRRFQSVTRLASTVALSALAIGPNALGQVTREANTTLQMP